MYKVSFCIPVYNNADVAGKIAFMMLKNPVNSFQLVFSDAGSTDNTKERLRAINDKRIKIVGFEKAVDGRMNWLNALENGDGDWLYLVMGRDKMNMDAFENLLAAISIAETEGILIIKDKQVTQMKLNTFEKYDRFGSYIELLTYDHPTGLVISREALSSSRNKREFFNKDYMYPENYLIQEFVQKTGNSMKICSGINTGDLFIDKSKVLSKMVKIGEEEELFWFPEKRIDHTSRVIRMVEEDNLVSEFQMGMIFLQKLKLLYLAIHFWKHECIKGTAFAQHYGIKQRHISDEEEANMISKAFSIILNEFSERNWCTPEIVEGSKIQVEEEIMCCYRALFD